MYCAVSRHRARVCVLAVGRGHIVNVRCYRCWHERAVSAFKRSTGLAATSAETRAVDVTRKTIHGISAAGHAAVSSLRVGRPARTGGRDLGELLSAGNQCRVLDERGVRFANRISHKAKCRARTHVRARVCEWHLFHRREISVNQSGFRDCGIAPGRLAGVHTGAVASRTGTGPFRLCRFYGRVVSHLQVQ